jgi:putative transposase
LKAGLKMQGCDIELMFQNPLLERFGEILPEPGTLEFVHDNGPETSKNSFRLENSRLQNTYLFNTFKWNV